MHEPGCRLRHLEKGLKAGFRSLEFWGFGVLGFWAFGLLYFWAFGLLWFWALRFRVSGVAQAPNSAEFYRKWAQNFNLCLMKFAPMLSAVNPTFTRNPKPILAVALLPKSPSPESKGKGNNPAA